MTATTVEVFAPAKINLALHVTGQRADGLHLLDSLVVFADIGDSLRVSLADQMGLDVTGPRAKGVPCDARNLCWQAAELIGTPAHITLDKHLPAAAGIGGGSSDAAAVLRALRDLTGQDVPEGLDALGADIPVCLGSRAARMQGIGEHITPVDLPALPAVLVNPGVEIPTPAVFKALSKRDHPAMEPPPHTATPSDLLGWLAAQRNDLQPAAEALAPEVTQALAALAPARLARMSGSGATCFGLCNSASDADAMARQIQLAHPHWWVSACTLR